MTETSQRLSADRYRIERELGQGGIATVYLAEDLERSRAEARARPRNGALKSAHASASRSLAEPALQSGTPILPGPTRCRARSDRLILVQDLFEELRQKVKR